jgi:hypothetical protein
LGSDVVLYQEMFLTSSVKKSVVITADGSVWGFNLNYGGSTSSWSVDGVSYVGNVIGGGAIPTTTESLGSVKGKYGGGN